jgi:hypothetical protein
MMGMIKESKEWGEKQEGRKGGARTGKERKVLRKREEESEERKERQKKEKRKRRKKICCNKVNGKCTVWNRKS